MTIQPLARSEMRLHDALAALTDVRARLLRAAETAHDFGLLGPWAAYLAAAEELEPVLRILEGAEVVDPVAWTVNDVLRQEG